MLKFIKEAIHLMTFFLQPPITLALNLSMFADGNDGSGFLFFDQIQNVIYVIASIFQNG